MKRRYYDSEALGTCYITSLDPLQVMQSCMLPERRELAVVYCSFSRWSFGARAIQHYIESIIRSPQGCSWDDLRPINEPPLLFTLAASDITSMTDGLNDANHSIRLSAIRDAKQIGPESRSEELNEAMQRIEEIQH